MIYKIREKFVVLIVLCTANQLSAQSADSLDVVDTLDNSIMTLDEVVVSAPLISQNKYGSTYLITESLREKVSSPVQMLNYIDGVIYNEIDNSVKVRTDSRVLLSVDGIERDLNYIMSLPPARNKEHTRSEIYRGRI